MFQNRMGVGDYNMENISRLEGSLQHPAGTDEVAYVFHGDHFENKFQYFQG